MTQNPFTDMIYLAGSFHGFRDRIIANAPSKKFVNPKFNRQHAMYASNQDDLEAAINTPVIAVCLVNGKDPGVMTFVELGAAIASGSKVLIADERDYPNDAFGKWLQSVAYEHFYSIDEMTEHMESSLVLPVGYAPTVHPDRHDKVTNVYFAGDMNYGLQRIAQEIALARTDFNIHLPSDDVMKDFRRFTHDGDLLVVHFPKNVPTDRKICTMIGGAEYHKIPVVGKIEGVTHYPPIHGGLFRRTFGDLFGLYCYLKDITTNFIGNEAYVIYDHRETFEGAKR